MSWLSSLSFSSGLGLSYSGLLGIGPWGPNPYCLLGGSKSGWGLGLPISFIFLGFNKALGTLPPLDFSSGLSIFVLVVVTFTTYSPSLVVSVFVVFLPKSAGGTGFLYLLISTLGCWYFETFWVVWVWVFTWVWFWFVLLSLTLVISVFVFVICVWDVCLLLGCVTTFAGAFSVFSVLIVLVVFVYCVFTGLYVSYNLGGTTVLFFCCLAVIELYWVKLVVVVVDFFIDSVSNLVFGTEVEVEVYCLTLGSVVYDENFLRVVRSKGVLSLSWCVIESLFGFFFLTFLVSWYP